MSTKTRKILSPILTLAMVLVLLPMFSTPAIAADKTIITGTLTDQSDVHSYTFVVDNALNSSGVTLRTDSYASGGFDPWLAVWGPAGNLISGFSMTWDNISGTELDAFIDLGQIADGTYTVTIGNSPNHPAGMYLSDGFTVTTADPLLPAGSSSNYRLIITGVVPICEIDETGVQYASIEDALAAVDDDETIILLTDVMLDADLEIDNGKTFTFDTNGKTLDFDGYALVISDGSKVNFVGCGNFEELAWIDVLGTDTFAEFDSDLTLLYGCLWADDGAEAIVNGNLTTLDGDGVNATDGAIVTIYGDIDAARDGVNAEGGAKVTVDGDITALDDLGVEAFDAGTEVIVTGSIKAPFGVYASDGATVTVTGSIDAEHNGVAAFDGAIVTVEGDIVALDGNGVYAQDAGTEVLVYGSVTAGEGLHAFDGAEVYIGSNVTLTGIDSCVIVAGVAYVHITGYLMVNNLADDGFYAAFCADPGSMLVVLGDVTSNKNGVWADIGGEIIIDGKLNIGAGMVYITLGPWYGSYIDLSAADITTPSTRSGYFTYTDGESSVWILDPTTLTPGTGDSATLWLLFGALMVAALGCGLVFAHRRREQPEN